MNTAKYFVLLVLGKAGLRDWLSRCLALNDLVLNDLMLNDLMLNLPPTAWYKVKNAAVLPLRFDCFRPTPID